MAHTLGTISLNDLWCEGWNLFGRWLSLAQAPADTTFPTRTIGIFLWVILQNVNERCECVCVCVWVKGGWGMRISSSFHCALVTDEVFYWCVCVCVWQQQRVAELGIFAETISPTNPHSDEMYIQNKKVLLHANMARMKRCHSQRPIPTIYIVAHFWAAKCTVGGYRKKTAVALNIIKYKWAKCTKHHVHRTYTAAADTAAPTTIRI